jgi:hypothetical protein
MADSAVRASYRFVNGELAPIVSPAEISEIEIAS